METKPLGPFLGVNNRLPDFALHKPKTGDYLRTADNVDITDAGTIVRRRGVTLLASMTNAHSLHMKTVGTGFLVRASVLYAITLPAYTETLLKVLTSDATMSYSQIGTDWYFSNGTDSGRITAGVAYPLGLPPMAAPALTVIGGALLAGWYQVGVAYVNTTTGEEGAISDIASNELTSTGGLRVTLPGALAGATHVNVYLSESNGTMPMLHSTVTTATATIDLTILATGRPTNGRNEDVLPAGTLFAHNGRLCSFKGNTVCIGLPFRPGYYLPLSGYIPFTEDVTIAISNQSGVFIAADQTRYFPGDLDDVQSVIVDLLPYGAVPGTSFVFPDKKTVGWFSTKGFVVGAPDGSIDATMADNIDFTPPAIGVAGVCECGGFRRVSSCGYSMNLATKAVTTYSDWAFTSLSRCFGTKVDGIYKTDTEAAVTSSVGFGKQNFGSEQLKFMPATYLGMKSSAVLKMRVQTPKQDYTYSSRGFSTTLQNQRVDQGKGLQATWFDLTLSNTAGADFTLATVSFAPINTTRRI